MRGVAWMAVLALGVVGCGVDRQQRVHDYAEDGVHLYQCGDYRHARETFEAALALDPGDATLQYNLAQCWERLGRDDKAESLYRDCVERCPNHADCRHALTVLMVRQGRRDEAVRMVQDWMARAPNLSGPYVEDAYLWHEYGDLRAALSRTQFALKCDSHDYHALVEMGRIYEDLHYPDRSVSLYEQALQYNPHQPDVEQRLAQLRGQGVGSPKPN
jgi:tetratricopeptide (TPR) repeat protein